MRLFWLTRIGRFRAQRSASDLNLENFCRFFLSKAEKSPPKKQIWHFDNNVLILFSLFVKFIFTAHLLLFFAFLLFKYNLLFLYNLFLLLYLLLLLESLTKKQSVTMPQICPFFLTLKLAISFLILKASHTFFSEKKTTSPTYQAISPK